MDTFKDKYNKFLIEYGKARKMVLSTSENDMVTSRMMSIIQIDGLFYFQTDKELRKYNQLINNHKVALCIDNIQIQGICKDIGHPTKNKIFLIIYKECYNNSYNMYTSLKNERLFVIVPTYLERWIYKDGIPFLELFDIEKKQYKLNKYISM